MAYSTWQHFGKNPPHAGRACDHPTVEALGIEPAAIEHRSAFVRITVPTTLTVERVFQSLTRAGVGIAKGGDGTEVLWPKFRF